MEWKVNAFMAIDITAPIKTTIKIENNKMKYSGIRDYSIIILVHLKTEMLYCLFVT